MTQQWQLSGNAESVDWSDLAMAGRAYADNLVGEPSVSKVMHMMADEIERLKTVIRSELYAQTDEKRVLYDTKNPRNGALSGRETVPDPDSRVWETQRTPQPHATPSQGSVQGGKWNEPVAWAVMERDGFGIECTFTDHDEACEWCDNRQQIVPLYRAPQPTLTDEEREAVEDAIKAVSEALDLMNGEDSRVTATLRNLLERLK